MALQQDERSEAELAEDDGYDLSAQIGFILRQVSQRHVSIFSEVMGTEITPTQWAVLSRLHAGGTSSQNELGRQTAMDVATVKGVVDRLSARGLIASRPDPEDGRRLILELTPEGSLYTQERLGPAAVVSKLTMQPLTAKQRSTLLRLLKRLL